MLKKQKQAHHMNDQMTIAKKGKSSGYMYGTTVSPLQVEPCKKDATDTFTLCRQLQGIQERNLSILLANMLKYLSYSNQTFQQTHHSSIDYIIFHFSPKKAETFALVLCNQELLLQATLLERKY